MEVEKENQCGLGTIGNGGALGVKEETRKVRYAERRRRGGTGSHSGQVGFKVWKLTCQSREGIFPMHISYLLVSVSVFVFSMLLFQH